MKKACLHVSIVEPGTMAKEIHYILREALCRVYNIAYLGHVAQSNSPCGERVITGMACSDCRNEPNVIFTHPVMILSSITIPC